MKNIVRLKMTMEVLFVCKSPNPQLEAEMSACKIAGKELCPEELEIEILEVFEME